MSTFPMMAFKAKAPYIGIPVEGKRPFAVKREFFIRATKGINITDFSVDSGENCRTLTITHVTGKVRGRYVFNEPHYHSVRSALVNWADGKRTARKAPKLDKFAIQIKRLAKDLVTPRTPRNPLLPSDSRYEGNYLRDMELAWKLDAPKRKELAKIAALVLSCKLTAGNGYKRMEFLGYTFKRLSQCPTRHGERIYSARSYWLHLPEICGLHSSPRDKWNRKPFEFDFRKMRDARMSYIADIRSNEAINSQIAALKALKSDTYSEL